jgi:hypothetical protein
MPIPATSADFGITPIHSADMIPADPKIEEEEAPLLADASRDIGFAPRALGSSRFLEKPDRIPDGDDRFGRIIRDFDTEFFFEGHDEFDRIERISAKVFNKIGIVDDLIGVDAEMLYYYLLHPLGDVAHDRVILVLLISL